MHYVQARIKSDWIIVLETKDVNKLALCAGDVLFVRSGVDQTYARVTSVTPFLKGSDKWLVGTERSNMAGSCPLPYSLPQGLAHMKVVQRTPTRQVLPGLDVVAYINAM
jgi:hypothetical protein